MVNPQFEGLQNTHISGMGMSAQVQIGVVELHALWRQVSGCKASVWHAQIEASLLGKPDWVLQNSTTIALGEPKQVQAGQNGQS